MARPHLQMHLLMHQAGSIVEDPARSVRTRSHLGICSRVLVCNLNSPEHCVKRVGAFSEGSVSAVNTVNYVHVQASHCFPPSLVQMQRATRPRHELQLAFEQKWDKDPRPARPSHHHDR